jgi:RimJ/RimL family protein N-acetyltransferase
MLFLRPVVEPDYPLLFRWYGDAQLPHLWNFHRQILSFLSFLGQLHRIMDSEQLRLICESAGSMAIGYCQSYDVNISNGWSYLALYLTPAHREPSTTIDSVKLAVNMIFESYPMVEKVYAESYDFSPHIDSALRAFGFVEEGSIPEHYWFGDGFWTQHRLAFYKEV